MHLRMCPEVPMVLRPIVKYPDPRLGGTCAPVETFDDDLRQLAEDLLETMRAAPGVGITAAHIGLPLRLVVLELSPQEAPCIYVNTEDRKSTRLKSSP